MNNKTIEEWLSMLPLDLYLLAVSYMDYEDLYMPAHSFQYALQSSFIWDNTKEGFEFWQQLATRDENFLVCFAQVRYYV